MGRDLNQTEAFAQEFDMGVATTDLRAALDDPKVDVVLITSPTDLHAEQAQMALAAGKDVLCEIPIATSLPETDRVLRAAEASGRTLMVCHTQRYYEGISAARRMVAEGQLHPHAFMGRQIRLRRENINWKGRRRTWTDNLLWHHACHSVDTALWVLGATEVDVVAQVALPGGNLNIPMDLSIVMRTPRDQIATILMSYNSHFALHDYMIFGEEASVVWEEDQLRTPEKVLAGALDASAQEEAIVRQDAEFFAAVRERREPAISARVVRPTMVVLQSVQDILDKRLSAENQGTRHPDLP